MLEVLSKVDSFFVGAKLAMFGLGFFSRHASERGLLIGIAAGWRCGTSRSTKTTPAGAGPGTVLTHTIRG